MRKHKERERPSRIVVVSEERGWLTLVVGHEQSFEGASWV